MRPASGTPAADPPSGRAKSKLQTRARMPSMQGSTPSRGIHCRRLRGASALLPHAVGQSTNTRYRQEDAGGSARPSSQAPPAPFGGLGAVEGPLFTGRGQKRPPTDPKGRRRRRKWLERRKPAHPYIFQNWRQLKFAASRYLPGTPYGVWRPSGVIQGLQTPPDNPDSVWRPSVVAQCLQTPPDTPDGVWRPSLRVAAASCEK
jgi:hypothetical protein